METVKCSKCGCVMSAMSEACPICGTPTANNSLSDTNINQSQVDESIKSGRDYTVRNDVRVLRGLQEAINEALAWSSKDEDGTYYIYTANSPEKCFGGGHDDCWALGCQANDIFIDFSYNMTDEERVRLSTLENKGLHEGNFGVDSEKATYLFSEFIRKVWLFDGEEEFDVVGA